MNSGVAGYSLTNELLMYILINGCWRLICSLQSANLDVWMRWLLVLCHLPDRKSYSFQSPAPGEQFFLSGRGVDAQLGRKKLEHVKVALASCQAFLHLHWLWGCVLAPLLAFKPFGFYIDHVKESLAQKLMMDENPVAPDSLSVVHGTLQHAGFKFCGMYGLCYHIYLIPEDVLSKRRLFAYSNSLSKAPMHEQQKAEDNTSVLMPYIRGHHMQASAIYHGDWMNTSISILFSLLRGHTLSIR